MADDTVLKVNKTRDNASPPSSDQSPARATTRSPSTRFASLRAAFEKDNNNGGNGVTTEHAVPRRALVSDRSAQEKALESELAALKDSLRAEQVAKAELEARCAGLESDLSQVRESLKDVSANGSHFSGQDALSKSETPQELPTAITGDVPVEPAVKQSDIKAAMHEVPVIDNQAELDDLRQQVISLKKALATSSFVPDQESDSSLAQKVDLLHHEFQNWIVTSFRRAKTEVSVGELCCRIDTIVENRYHALLKTICQAWDPSSKMVFYQACAICYIMEIFEDTLLYGLPACEWRKPLRKAVEGLSETVPASTYNDWRRSTVDMLLQTPSLDTQAAAQVMSELICITMEIIADLSIEESQKVSLTGIVQKFIRLSHTFRVQRSPYTFVLYEPAAQYIEHKMDDISAHKMDDISEHQGDHHTRTVRLCTFPAVLKLDVDDRTRSVREQVIVKARVLCGNKID